MKLIDVTRDDALQAFLNGSRVRVLTEYSDGSMEIQTIEDLFPNEDTHYLVDEVKADVEDSRIVPEGSGTEAPSGGDTECP